MSGVVLMTDGFGAFGKMPSVGDFFRLGARPGFVEAWDGWLQEGLLSCGQAYGEGWDGLYMSAPIWRFTLAPGQAGSRGALGVLMPSVDRVGRRFPLTLMAPLPEGADVAEAHFANAALFAQAEDLALEALDDMPKEQLEDRLAGLPAPGGAGGVTGTPTALQGPDLAALAAALAARGLGRTPGSLWSAQLDGDARLIACAGLPSRVEFAALMNLAAPLWRQAA